MTLSQGTFGEAAPSFSRPTLAPLRMGTRSGEGGGLCIGSLPLHCPGPASLPPPPWVSLNTSEHPPLPAAQSSIRGLPDQEASAPTQPPAQGTAQSTEGPPVPCGPRGDRQLPAPGAGWPKPQWASHRSWKESIICLTEGRTGSTRSSLGTEPVSGAARPRGAGRGQTLPSKAFRCFLSQGLQRASASGVCRINLMTCEKDFEED